MVQTSRDRGGLGNHKTLPLNHGNRVPGPTLPCTGQHLHLDPEDYTGSSAFFSLHLQNLLGFILVSAQEHPRKKPQEFHLRSGLS